MKHVNNPRRGRSRNNGKRHSSPNGRNFDGGGEARVRGTAKQVLDKYLALARDAASAGNRVTSEGYLQHAEHYYRVLNAEPSGDGQNSRNRRGSSGHEKPRADRADETDNVVKKESSGDKAGASGPENKAGASGPENKAGASGPENKAEASGPDKETPDPEQKAKAATA